MLVAAEPLEADDADRPRAEAALALQPRRDRVGRLRLQPLEVERAAEPDERRGAGARRARARELRGREARRAPRAVGGACRPPSAGAAARMIARSICRARLAWISWPATARSSACATVAVRIGRSPRSRRSVSPSSGSSREAAQELASGRRRARARSGRGRRRRRCRRRPRSSRRRAATACDALEPVVDADRRAVGAVDDDAASRREACRPETRRE